MRDVVGYENIYGITSCGKVYSYKSKKFLKPKHNVNGYLMVALYRDGQKKWYKVHRLVAMTYIPNPDNLPQVNHKDENKANNCLQNLEWCDASYNTNYGTRNEKVSNKLKKPILQCTLDGEFVREWSSATDVGKEVMTNIRNCLRGKQKTAYGFIWKYKDDINTSN